MLVDSHCHLNFPDFRDDIDDVIARATEAGVKVMQTICTEMSEFEEVYAIAERYKQIYASVGVHPNDSGKTDIVDVDTLVAHAKRPKVIGIGETGLDYHYETSDRQTQITSFYNHIAAAQQTGLPLIVHTRDADDDTMRILEAEMKKAEFRLLIHCFTSSKALADKAVELGGYISLSGIITFKSAQAIRDGLVDVPLSRMLVETDSPYLAPTPNRGKRNEPSFVKYTNKMLAELKVISEGECAKVTTANFFTLFDKISDQEKSLCA